jgi:hypothetical protein
VALRIADAEGDCVMDDLLLKVAELAAALLAGAVTGLFGGRREARDRIRADRKHSLEATDLYLMAGLDHLVKVGQLPDSAEFRDKDDRLIGDANLFERWLRVTVECWPHRGDLSNAQLGQVSTLRTDVSSAIAAQRQRIQSGKKPLLADLDSPTVHTLRVALDEAISGAKAPP